MVNVANPITHAISLLMSSGALITAFAAGNEIENQGLENKTEVKQVKKQVEQMDDRQREILKILIRVETKLENE